VGRDRRLPRAASPAAALFRVAARADARDQPAISVAMKASSQPQGSRMSWVSR
jgi:hypothetical protein